MTCRCLGAWTRGDGRTVDTLLQRGHGRSQWLPILARSMFIKTQETPNPASLKFIPGTKVSNRHGRSFFRLMLFSP
jgi:hypothetical protein